MEVNKTYGSLNCVYCELNFSSKEEMMFHLLTDNVVKPLICLECNQRYAYKGPLTKYMGIHMKEKLFLCSNCDMLFFRRTKINVT